MTKRGSAYLLVLTSALCYAIGGNVVKTLFAGGSTPLALAQLRIGFAFLWLLLFMTILRPSRLRVPGREMPHLLLFGWVAVAGVQLVYYLAIARINIAVAVFTQFTAIVGVAAWERFRRDQPVSTRLWLAIALVLGGAFLMVGAYRPALLRLNLPGIGLSLLAAVLLAAYLLRASTLITRIDRFSVLLYGFGAGTLLWVVIDLIAHPALPRRVDIWVTMALIGLFGTLLPFGLQVTALRVLRPSVVGIFATAEPVFAGIIAFLLFKDAMEPLQVLGAAVVCVGIVLAQASDD
ncbi:MAG: DMT family transporter [Candidatus Dormibacteraeota bacterium]|nr:DMT family transporter [Candidatus Dormibacteraeota bacterium]